MATTESGIYYQDDYNVPADILTDMKKMAESTDKVIKENKYNDTPIKTDLQAIKQEQQDQNSKIENNTTENKDNSELLNQIMGLLPSTKGEGEHVTLQDTGEARFKNFQVQGNSKQETRSGKNKFDGNFSQGYDSSGKITSSRQFICNTNLINVVQNKTYTISNNLNLKIASIAYYKDNEFVNLKSNIASNTINIPENVNQIRFNLYREQGLSVSEINMCQLEEGEIATDYEQYGASPSPEFPSKIRNVVDNINLFNKDGNVILSYDSKLEPIETGVKVTLKIVGTSKYCAMKLGGSELSGKTLVAHGNIFCSGQNDTLIGYYFGTDNNFLKKWIIDSGNIRVKDYKYKQVFTIPDTFPEGCNSIYIILYANGISTEAKVGDYVEYRDFKIEEGTHATPYSPYNCGNTEVTVCNKNLAISDFEQYYNSPTAGYVLCPLKLKKGSTYKFTAKLTGEQMVGLVNYGIVRDGNSYEEFVNNASFVLDLSGKIFDKEFTVDDKFITPKLVCWAKTEDIFNNLFKNYEIQLTEKTNTDSFVQHKQQTILFPFTEGQRLYKGDYLAEDGIHHTRKKIVLDGTEVWQLGGSGNNTTNQRFYIYKDFIKANGDIACNYLKQVYKGSIDIFNNDVEGCNVCNGQYIQIKINKKIASTVDKLNDWIKQKKNEGNPLTFECELDKEEVEPYTQKQQKTYKQQKKLHSYNEQTNIFSKDEISPVFNVEAIKNLNATFAQLSATMLERS